MSYNMSYVVRNWEELEPGMVAVPAMSMSDSYVIYFFSGGDYVGLLREVGIVTILRNHIEPQARNARGTSRSNLRMLSVLSAKGIFTLVITDEHPIRWWVNA